MVFFILIDFVAAVSALLSTSVAPIAMLVKPRIVHRRHDL
jgi:hypothetical protein